MSATTIFLGYTLLCDASVKHRRGDCGQCAVFDTSTCFDAHSCSYSHQHMIAVTERLRPKMSRAKADAPNPAMMLWFQFAGRWRGSVICVVDMAAMRFIPLILVLVLFTGCIPLPHTTERS